MNTIKVNGHPYTVNKQFVANYAKYTCIHFWSVNRQYQYYLVKLNGNYYLFQRGDNPTLDKVAYFYCTNSKEENSIVFECDGIVFPVDWYKGALSIS